MKYCKNCDLHWENHRTVCPECCCSLSDNEVEDIEKTVKDHLHLFSKYPLYAKLEWPDSQAVMNEPWYGEEAFVEDMVCFIPLQRAIKWSNKK